MKAIKSGLLQSAILSFCVVLFMACSNQTNQTNSQDSVQAKDSISEQASINSDFGDFQAFWVDFRKAVIDQDSVKLAAMANFPLNSHGVLDSDPQDKIAKDRFYYYFKICLNEPTGLSADQETNLAFIKRSEVLKNDKYVNIQDNWCRVSDLEFERIEGNWKLVRIYFDTAKSK